MMMNATTSSSSPSSNKKHNNSKPLLEPTSEVPWKVEVVSCAPRSVVAEAAASAGAGSSGGGGGILASASCGRWHCVAVAKARASEGDDDAIRVSAAASSAGRTTTPKNKITAATATRSSGGLGGYDDVELHVWYDDPSESLVDQKLRPAARLRHPQLRVVDNGGVGGAVFDYEEEEEDDDVLLLAMDSSVSPSPDERVCVYAAHRASGAVVAFKVTRRDLLLHAVAAAANEQDRRGSSAPGGGAKTTSTTATAASSSSSSSSVTFIKLDADDDEVLTSLDAGHGRAAAGTSRGGVSWITPTFVPMALRVRTLPNAAAATAAGGGVSSTAHGILSRLSMLITPAKKQRTSSPSSLSHGASGVVKCMIQGKARLTCAVRRGQIVRYEAESGAQGEAAAAPGIATPLANLLPALQERLSGIPPLRCVRVVASCPFNRSSSSSSNEADDEDGFHVLVLTRHSKPRDSDSSYYDDDFEDGGGSPVLPNSAGYQDLSRIYWLRLVRSQKSTMAVDADTAEDADVVAGDCLEIQAAHYLNRFVAPEDVTVGPNSLVATLDDCHSAYAAFTAPNLPIIVMSMDGAAAAAAASGTRSDEREQQIVYEVDLDVSKYGDAIWSMDNDIISHGCFATTSEGLGLRIRRIPMTAPSAARMTTALTAASSSATNPATLATLTSHLRSCFWTTYRNPRESVPLPPSLLHASKSDLEAAVLVFGQQLLLPPNYDQHEQSQKNLQSFVGNLLDWHSAYINMLQQTGLYRSLSQFGRWKLLGLGQQVAVYQALVLQHRKNKTPTAWENSCYSLLTSADHVASWLLDIQISGERMYDDEQRAQYVDWLVLVMTEATAYREERAATIYDISVADGTPRVRNPEDAPLFTSCPQTRAVLRNQIDDWKQNNRSAGTASTDTVETIVKVALQSFGDTYNACPTNETQLAYAQMQKDAIALIANDKLAFSLSLEHAYFEGLCELALKHEKKKDHLDYSLEHLFETVADDVIYVSSGLMLSSFACRYHAERGLLGHAIQYGKYCPETLSKLMEELDDLKPYRWIQAVRNADYSGATSSLLDTSAKENAGLGMIKRSLDIASIANAVVEKVHEEASGMYDDGVGGGHEQRRQIIIPEDGHAKRRRVIIDKMRERVNVQNELRDESADEGLWSADRLVDYAIGACEKSEFKEDKIHACFLGLVACTTYESDNDVRANAVSVWKRAVLEDWPMWEKWVTECATSSSGAEGGPDLARSVRESTVFGGLVSKSNESLAAVAAVQYRGSVEDKVCEDLSNRDGTDDAMFETELRRLLQSAAEAEPLGLVEMQQ